MAAYYNEYDPKAAAWLRELIKQGHIADGEVDDRSIEDVTPTELAGFTQCHFFAGIGVWSYALRQAGWADDRPVWTGSCPCQPFSAAGKGAGFDDERHLWPAFHHLISQCRPDVVFGEQVASKDGLGWLDLVQSDLEATGYAGGAVDLCAAGVGAPHIRQRLWWVGERLDNTTGARRFGAIRDAEGFARDEARLRMSSVGLEAGGLADADNARRQLLTNAKPAGIRGEASSERQQVQQSSTDGTSDGSMADASVTGSQGRLLGRADQGREDQLGHGGRGGAVSGLADTSGSGLETVGGQRNGTGDAAGWQGSKWQFGSSGTDGRPSPTNGHWRDADWLFCRDGKWRPVEPGTSPLAHGSAARVGRLRGYGNAIVAQAAQAFIESVMGE